MGLRTGPGVCSTAVLDVGSAELDLWSGPWPPGPQAWTRVRGTGAGGTREDAHSQVRPSNRRQLRARRPRLRWWEAATTASARGTGPSEFSRDPSAPRAGGKGARCGRRPPRHADPHAAPPADAGPGQAAPGTRRACALLGGRKRGTRTSGRSAAPRVPVSPWAGGAGERVAAAAAREPTWRSCGGS